MISIKSDDASGSGTIFSLRQWWDQINILGPKFGYFPNPSKTWLLAKSATTAFAGALQPWVLPCGFSNLFNNTNSAGSRCFLARGKRDNASA